MNKSILILLVIMIFFGPTLQLQSSEQLNWAEIWETLDENDKSIFLLGCISEAINDVILLSEFASEKEDIKIVDFFMDFAVYIVEYISFYGENDNNGNVILDLVDDLYYDSDNKYCNAAGLAFLGYLQLQGKDVSKELVRLRYYAEFGTETLFRK